MIVAFRFGATNRGRCTTLHSLDAPLAFRLQKLACLEFNNSAVGGRTINTEAYERLRAGSQ